jgi:hypothetical protein
MQGNSKGDIFQVLIPLLARHPLFAKESLETHYSFTHDDVHRHAAWLDFDRLSRNANVQWTEALIEEFLDRWEWEMLSHNVLLSNAGLLSDQFIARHHARWDEFVLLALQGDLEEDESQDVEDPRVQAELDRVTSPQDQRRLAWLRELTDGHWAEKRVDELQEKVDFHAMSFNSSVEWSLPLLLRYECRWKWSALAGNSAVWERLLEPHGKTILEWFASTCPGTIVRPIPAKALHVTGKQGVNARHALPVLRGNFPLN